MFKSFALILALIPGLAMADTSNLSPFAYAESHKKAERDAEEAKAGEARVIGGQLANEGEWPWQVALMVAGTPNSPDNQFCGGSMILDTWVLTAAHCVVMPDENGNAFDLAPNQFEVLVGTNTLAPGKGERVPVVAVFRHPAYTTTQFDNDIALVKLARAPKVKFQTITVPDAEFGDYLDQPGVPTVVTGWGLVNGAKHPALMFEAEIEMLDREQCNASMLEASAEAAAEPFSYAVGAFGLNDTEAQRVWEELVNAAPKAMSDNMLCSGTYEGGRTSCQGDSGGPLVVPLDDGTYIQAGIVSWGLTAASSETCDETALFSAYTKIAKFVPWLDQVLNAN